MPFAPRIRKDILKALDKHIIPALWKQQIPLGYVAPPLQFPSGISKRLINARMPRPDTEPPEFPVQERWTKAKLNSTYYPYLSFIYEGIADERTLITAAQAKQHSINKGMYALRWQAPSALLFSPGAPRNMGSKAFWEDSNAHPSITKILQLAFSDEILVHIHVENALQTEEHSHSLQIKDVSLISLASLFHEELRRLPTGNQDTAQAVLLTLMLRLRDYLHSHSASIANTSYSPVALAKPSSERNVTTWQKANSFIQMHLHEQLSLPLIAQKVAISPAHLNNLFHQFSGTSVMRYVRQQRIMAAKEILAERHESIKEIAVMLNFKNSAAFCSVFRHETGLTPKQFRRQATQHKSTLVKSSP